MRLSFSEVRPEADISLAVKSGRGAMADTGVGGVGIGETETLEKPWGSISLISYQNK